MVEYRVCKWGYIEALEDLLNGMTTQGWRLEAITQPLKLGESVGTVTFSRLTSSEPQRIDEGDEDE